MAALGGAGCGPSKGGPADSGPPPDAGADAVTADAPLADAPDAAADAGDAVMTADARSRPVLAPPPGVANAYAAGDPAYAGQSDYLNGTWGTEQLDEWPPAQFVLDLMQNEPTVFGNQLAAFGFLPDANDDFPIGLKRGDVDPTRLHETCAMCHVGRLPDGTFWLGLPNGELDYLRLRYELDQRWTAAGNPSLLSDDDRMKFLNYGPGRAAADGQGDPLVPADFPVYFHLSERKHLNHLGTGTNLRTEAYFALYAFGAGAPNAMTARVPFPSDDDLKPLLDFMGNLSSPPPPPGDATLIAMGRAVFTTAKCDSCHHLDDLGADDVVTLDETAGGMERLPGDDPAFPRGSIRTDSLHWDISEGGAGTGAEGQSLADYVAFIAAHRLAPTMSDGYRTPQLDGVWATAPYLHNGSVPTLEDLLLPAAQRPATFMNHGFMVDTTVKGNGNQGHEWGTTLPDDQKAALVAFLKSL
jgi:hypothetical protein